MPASTTERSDAEWLAAAAALALRGRPLSRPNPAVGAIVVRDGVVVGRGWTQPGGRPHAEAIALGQAGDAARNGTLYVTLEPCAHRSQRGPACADLAAAAGLARVVIAVNDPDPRTAGSGTQRIASTGAATALVAAPPAEQGLAGYLTRTRLGCPHVTLKLALSEDCRLAPHDGQWLTGEIARAHVHAWRAKMDAILVGRGTLEADAPRLDVRLPGIETRSRQRWLLTSGGAPSGWCAIAKPEGISTMGDIQWLMVEGGAATARAFLHAGLVDRLMLYRAPLSVGGDGAALPELGAPALAEDAEWTLIEQRALGADRLDVYDRSSLAYHSA